MTHTGSKSPGSAKHLIESMTGSDALPVFVQRIDPHTLKSLVDEVGLEDSGALIAHVSPNQLVHLLDETLWTGAKPGDPDKLSIAELLRWLDVLNGVSPEFAADKLFELGDDFCALAFSRLLIVSDSDLTPRVLDEHTQAIGPYLVRTRVDDEWDTVQTAVNALWRDFPDFAEAVFARLAFRHSALRMFGEDDTARVLDADAGYAHEQGREEAGYVTSITAGSFLRELARSDVDDLSAETTYDLQTQEYFRRRRQLQRGTARDDVDVETEDVGVQTENVETEDVETEKAPVTEAELAELQQLEAELEAFERARHRPVALLTGPESDPDGDWIRLALDRLQAESECFDARMDELTYLANLLKVGIESGGERLDSTAAARLVVSTCNLGASHELWLENETDPVDAVLGMLHEEPGLVRLFRIGWHLLARLPGEAAERVIDLFTDSVVRDCLAEKPWVLEEVDALLGGSPDFAETVAGRDFEDARETLKILGIALEAEAVVVLCVLTDGIPKFARVLEERPPEGAAMTYASRDIATMSDLMAVHRFLDALGSQVRL